jgi:hypothetical protein
MGKQRGAEAKKRIQWVMEKKLLSEAHYTFHLTLSLDPKASVLNDVNDVWQI